LADPAKKSEVEKRTAEFTEKSQRTEGINQAILAIIALPITAKPTWFENVDGLDKPFIYYNDRDPVKAQIGAAKKLNHFIWQQDDSPLGKGNSRELREEMILSELFDHQWKSALLTEGQLAIKSGQQPAASSLTRSAYEIRNYARDLEATFKQNDEHLPREALSKLMDRTYEMRFSNIKVREKMKGSYPPIRTQDDLKAFNKAVDENKDYRKISLMRSTGALDEKAATEALTELGADKPAELAKSAVIRHQLELVRDISKSAFSMADEASVVSQRLAYKNRMSLELEGVGSAVTNGMKTMKLYRFDPDTVLSHMNNLDDMESRLVAAQTQHALDEAWSREHRWQAVGYGGYQSVKGILWGAIDDTAGFFYNVGEAGYFGTLGITAWATGSEHLNEQLESQVEFAGAWNAFEEGELPWYDLRRHSFFTNENLEHSKRKRATFIYSGVAFGLTGLAGNVEGLAFESQLARMGIVEKTTRALVGKLGDRFLPKAIENAAGKAAEATASGSAKAAADGAAGAAAGAAAAAAAGDAAGEAAAKKGFKDLAKGIWQDVKADPKGSIRTGLTTPIRLFGEPMAAATGSIQGAMREHAMNLRRPLAASPRLLESTKFNLKEWLARRAERAGIYTEKMLVESAGLVVPGLAVQYFWNREELGNSPGEFGFKVGENVGSTIVFLIALQMVHGSISGAGAKTGIRSVDILSAATSKGLSFGIMHHIGKNFVSASTDYLDLMTTSNRRASHLAIGRSEGFNDEQKADRQIITNFWSQLLNMGYIVGSAKVGVLIDKLPEKSKIRKRLEAYYEGQYQSKEEREKMKVENFTKNISDQIKYDIVRGQNPEEFVQARKDLLEPDAEGRSAVIRVFEKFMSRRANPLEEKELHDMVDRAFENGIASGENLRSHLLGDISDAGLDRLLRLKKFIGSLPPLQPGQTPEQLAARKDQIATAYRDSGLPPEFFFITREGRFERDAISRRLERLQKDPAAAQDLLGVTDASSRITSDEFESLVRDLAFGERKRLAAKDADFGASYDVVDNGTTFQQMRSVLRDTNGRMMGTEIVDLDSPSETVRLNLKKLGVRLEFYRGGPKPVRDFVHENGTLTLIAKDGTEFELLGEQTNLRIKEYTKDGTLKEYRNFDEARASLRLSGVGLADYAEPEWLPTVQDVPIVSENRVQLEYDLKKGVRVSGTVITRNYTDSLGESVYPDGSVKAHIKVGEDEDRKVYDIPMPRMAEPGRNYWFDQKANELVMGDINGLWTVIDAKAGKATVYVDRERKFPVTEYMLDEYVKLAAKFAFENAAPAEQMAAELILRAGGSFKQKVHDKAVPTADMVVEALAKLEIPSDEFYQAIDYDAKKAVVMKYQRKAAAKYHPDRFQEFNPTTDANQKYNPAVVNSLANEVKWKELNEKWEEINTQFRKRQEAAEVLLRSIKPVEPTAPASGGTTPSSGGTTPPASPKGSNGGSSASQPPAQPPSQAQPSAAQPKSNAGGSRAAIANPETDLVQKLKQEISSIANNDESKVNRALADIAKLGTLTEPAIDELYSIANNPKFSLNIQGRAFGVIRTAQGLPKANIIFLDGIPHPIPTTIRDRAEITPEVIKQQRTADDEALLEKYVTRLRTSPNDEFARRMILRTIQEIHLTNAVTPKTKALLAEIAAKSEPAAAELQQSASIELQILDSSSPVLVYYGYEGCRNCRATSPEVDLVAAALAGKVTVIKVDVEKQRPFAKGFRGYPSFRFYKAGALVGQDSGRANKDVILAAVNSKLIP
jgi:thioredoxin 1